MDMHDGGRRYTGYDEYEGIFGSMGGVYRGHASSRSLSAKYERSGPSNGGVLGLGTTSSRGFPSAVRRTSARRTGGALSTNGYERRERYLRDRVSKRRTEPVGGDAFDEEDAGEEQAAANPLAMAKRQAAHQIWLPTKNFSFRQRAGKLDTRTIARLDLQKIVATTDVETIQRHLDNVAFSDVTLDDVQQYSDAYFLKLFQIAQLTLEYLINVQSSLANHCERLETQCEGLADECQTLEVENLKVESEISALRKEIRQKQSTLATFEVMLLNATAAKRTARPVTQQQLDQENDPAVLNILGLSPSQGEEEKGAVPLVSSCVLCGKNFISPEYLVRHQHKKHRHEALVGRRQKPKKKKDVDDSSSAKSDSQSPDSGGGSDTRKKTKKPRAPQAAPLPAEVVQALSERSELSRQLMEMQFELRREKEKRAEEAKLAEQQQAQLTNQLAVYMAKLQETLVEMERKQEQGKHEMMRYTQETIDRARSEAAEREKKTSRAGKLESDDDGGQSASEKQRNTAEEIEKRILDSLLRSQAEIHHKNSELEMANRKLQTKLRRRARQQLPLEPPPATTLLSMAAIDAQRFGNDAGGMIEDIRLPPAKPKAVAVEDKPVQTDEERDDLRKTKPVTQSQQVQTEIEVATKQEPTSAAKQPPPSLQKAESKIPKPVVDAPKPVSKPIPKPEQHAKPVDDVKSPPPPAEPTPPMPEPVVETKSESKLQHAAHLVGKVALGFLARKALKNPSNWLLTLPASSLHHALNERELETLTHHHGGQLQDVTVEIEDDMTANDLRAAFADALSGGLLHQQHGEETAADGDVAVDHHRILLHHRATGEEISGNQFIYHLRNQLDVEVVPSFEAAHAHVDEVLGFHDEVSTRLRAIRRASMEFAPGELPVGLGRQTHENSEAAVARLAVRIQSVVRCFLAKRTLEMLKIDRLVEARLLSLCTSPQTRSRSVSSQRRMTCSASVAAIRVETTDERVVTAKATQIHERLADLVKQKTGVDTRTKSAKWSRGRLSTEDYERQVEETEQRRKLLPADVQGRIAQISERVQKLIEEEYDPQAAKQEAGQYVAATRIQSALQVIVARRKLLRLLGRSKEGDSMAVRQESETTIEKEKESRSSRGSESEKEPDHPEEEKTHEKPTPAKGNDEDEGAEEKKSLDVDELDDDVEIRRLADAYERATEFTTPDAKPEPNPKPVVVVEEKPKVEVKPSLPPRAGTPPPTLEDLAGRSPRPSANAHVISPFSKTPLLSRRPAVTRRGSGYDNAR